MVPSSQRFASLIVMGISTVTAVGLVPLSGLAQTNARNIFPGRRVAGGTRGDCAARVLAHLVPSSSMYAPGSKGLLGLIQGPVETPTSVTIDFLTESGETIVVKQLQAAGPVLTLIRAPADTQTMIWESSFRCEELDEQTPKGELDFISDSPPPARSLLVSASSQLDADENGLTVNALKAIKQQCGSTVSTRVTLSQFGFQDLQTPRWPDQLPVVCSF